MGQSEWENIAQKNFESWNLIVESERERSIGVRIFHVQASLLNMGTERAQIYVAGG